MSTSSTNSNLCLLSLDVLAELIATGEASSREIVEAHAEQIEALNPHLRAFSQLRLSDALREADKADAAVAAGDPLGPLHGVPVSIKDCFAVEGLETTLGIPGFSDRPDARDSPLVERLRAAGAIVLGKTNVPQGMLMHECDNPLFGCTLHPVNDQRSPGGSSGGEAVAVAAGMSPLGLASDLGGSTRQPAHACGVVGFKPTSNRLTMQGSRRAIQGMKALTICPGPMTRSVSDADLAMRVLLDSDGSPTQPDERPDPWPDYWKVDVPSLRVAYWTDNGVAPASAGVARAVESAADELRSLGAEVQCVVPPSTEAMLRIYLGLISADGMQSLARLLEGGEVNPQIGRQVRKANAPRWVRRVIGTGLSIFGQGALSNLLHWSGPRSADEYWRFTVAAADYHKHFWREVDRAFDGQPVDVILNPPHSLPALRHNSGLYLLLEASHCYLANLLDAPAGVVPRVPVTNDEQQQAVAAERNTWAVDGRLRRLNAEDSAGLPVGVQVMARPWRDDVALAVMAALESGQ